MAVHLKHWEKLEAKKRILEILEKQAPLSPRQMFAKSEEVCLLLTQEMFSELVNELFTEKKIRMVNIGLSYISKIKSNSNVILEAFFSAVR